MSEVNEGVKTVPDGEAVAAAEGKPLHGDIPAARQKQQTGFF